MTDDEKLTAPLTPNETRWAIELADKLPGDADITFEEAKILARLPIERWPSDLLARVRDAIDFEDFLDGAEEDDAAQ